MPVVHDLARVERILSTDRVWSGYALADLDPGFKEHCRWIAAPEREDALLLVFAPFQPAVLFALGEPETLRPLIEEVPAGAYSLSVPTDVARLLEECGFETRWRKRMNRMFLPTGGFRRAEKAGVAALSPNDLGAVEELFADGEATGEKPDFFFADMLRTGAYYGVWEGGRLTAAAGTHLYSEAQSSAGVGNVYVRRDRRGRGLGRAVASAVTNEVLRRGTRTVVLNVERENLAAQRIYERLGYAFHCEFAWSEAEKR